MAGTIEQQTTTDGASTGAEFEVINPATGEVIGRVPDMSPEQVTDLARRGRAAQPGWEALGFEGRARILKRAQKWVLDNADRVIKTIVSETGKTYEDAMFAEISYAASAFGFWAKNAADFLADERVAEAAVFDAMQNGGQTCISIERAYVEARVYDEFVAKVTEKARALRQGVPGEPGTVDVGAITFPRQLEIIEDHVNDAVAHGAKVLVGGHKKDGPGQFFEPTILVDVTPEMKAMREETFGPTLPIMKVADAEEAI